MLQGYDMLLLSAHILAHALLSIKFSIGGGSEKPYQAGALFCGRGACNRRDAALARDIQYRLLIAAAH